MTSWHGITPRAWQVEALPLALASQRGVIRAATGCHAKGQGIMMHDGSMKRVEDVEVDDLLMGPDSTPRRVLRLIRGSADLYEIKPVKGAPWVVNPDHILTLVDTTDREGALIDISLRDWMGLNNYTKHKLKLIRAGVDFDQADLPIEPYLLGVLLGDGHLAHGVSVCNSDHEVMSYLQDAAARWGLVTRVDHITTHLCRPHDARGRAGHPLIDALKELELYDTRAASKFVPHIYKTASQDQRLELLAGLLDTDGSYSNTFDYISKSEALAQDVAFLARSCGLAAYVKPCIKRCQGDFSGTYYRVSISGAIELIPTKVERKQAKPRAQIKSVLRTGFSVRSAGEGAYYGFELDGDRRYLLDDFTITHNSGKSILQAEVVAHALPSLEDDERIVVSVPTQELVRQLAATIRRRVGHDKVSCYYQHERSLQGQVIVTCHASMAGADPILHCPECDGEQEGARELDGDERSTARAIMVAWGMDDEQPTICVHLDTHQRVQELKPVGLAGQLLDEGLRVALWMADECHKTETAQVIQWHRWVQPARQVGFTATPWRADEKQRLSLWDEILYDYGPMDAIRDGVILAPTIIGWEGKGSRDEASLELITDHLRAHPGPGVVSASSVEDAQGFASMLGEVGVRAKVISYRDKGDARDRLLGELKDGELDALVYCSLLAEGVDLPWLQWLCLRRGAGSRVRLPQEVGRVVRTYPGKTQAWVLDPCGAFEELSLDYEAVLGWEVGEQLDPLAQLAADLFKEIQEEDGEERDAPQGTVGRVKKLQRARWARWLNQVVMAMRLRGWCELRVASTSWRVHPMSQAQLQLIAKTIKLKQVANAAERLRGDERALLRLACIAARSMELTKGQASDLIDVITQLGRQGNLPR